MPDLRGENLQVAQEAVQSVHDTALFYTASENATGRRRQQVTASDWILCSQVPAAGSTFDGDTLITLQSVMVSEDCP